MDDVRIFLEVCCCVDFIIELDGDVMDEFDTSVFSF